MPRTYLGAELFFDPMTRPRRGVKPAKILVDEHPPSRWRGVLRWRLRYHPRLDRAVTVGTIGAMVLFLWVSVDRRSARLAERRELNAAVMFMASERADLLDLLAECRAECEP